MTQSMQTIRALSGGRLETAQRPIPSPAHGQVLVKVHCSPVNPSDRMQIAGVYVQNREPPFTPGLLGVGTVVDAANAGLRGRFISGKRVVFAPGPELEGTWAQYAIAPIRFCLPLAAGLSDTDGVNLLANPTTAIGLLDLARAAKAKAVVMTAAAGEVGRFLNLAARARGIQVINLVHREEQVRLLRGEGADHVLNSGTPDFEAKLASLAGKLGATVAFDGVAGDLTRQLLTVLPDGSDVVMLGRLSGQDVAFDGQDLLVGRQMRLSGFNVNLWLAKQSTFGVLAIARKAAALVRQGGGTRVQHRVDLSTLASQFDELAADQSAGKTIVFPNSQS